MRQFYTANLETSRTISGEFFTEPYEAAWASEAIFYVRVEAQSSEHADAQSMVQMSLDGLTWVDEGAAVAVDRPGDAFVRVSHFGGWLRLRTQVAEGESLIVSLYLVLKE